MHPLLLIWYPTVFVTTVLSFKFEINPDDSLPFEPKAKSHGYPVEKFKTVTGDGYHITLYRIPHGIHQDNATSSKSPVLLIPGMGVGAAYFLCMGKYRSLPYYLADRGYDVWLLNMRGTSHSRGHNKYNLDRDSKYWDYSLHELGVYDLPAGIDLIIEKTDQKPFLIGHSQGNTDQFIMCAEKPEYNDKIKMSFAYAPSLVLHHLDIPIASFFIYIVEVIAGIYKLLGLNEVYPFGQRTADIVQYLSNNLCSEKTYFKQLCINIVSIIGSHPSKMIDDEALANIVASERVRFSSRTLFHYMQIAKYKRLAQYDFGPEGNLRRYGAKKPPLYDMSKAVAPVAVFYAPRDDIITVQGAIETIELLPNVVFQQEVPDKSFNHIDFILGSNSTFLVFQPTIELMRAYDEGKMDTKPIRKKG